MVSLLAAAAYVGTLIVQHGFMIIPPIRNAVDYDLPPWANGSFPAKDGSPGCNQLSYGNKNCGCWCTNGTSACESGQSCMWFSQGCSIGCLECDGVSARNQTDVCNNGMKAILCDPRVRTYNLDAECNSQNDTFRHNPWRAPGTAPIYDTCGKAGGGNIGPLPGNGGAFFYNTTNSKEGDLGSKALKPRPTGIVWTAGSQVEAMWSIRANHGGGYQYRLCPSNAELTESCMKNNPIRFVGKMQMQFKNGSRLNLEPTYVYENGTGVFTYEGEIPQRGAWARNPIPDFSYEQPGLNFPAPCDDVVDAPTFGLCSGHRPYHISIVDVLEVPDVPTGDYVLGWRWDCEETAQVWNSCADISIVNNKN